MLNQESNTSKHENPHIEVSTDADGTTWRFCEACHDPDAEDGHNCRAELVDRAREHLIDALVAVNEMSATELGKLIDELGMLIIDESPVQPLLERDIVRACAVSARKRAIARLVADLVKTEAQS